MNEASSHRFGKSRASPKQQLSARFLCDHQTLTGQKRANDRVRGGFFRAHSCHSSCLLLLYLCCSFSHLPKSLTFSKALVRFGEVTDFLEKIKFGDLKDEGYLKVTTPEMDFVIEAVSNENYVVPLGFCFFPLQIRRRCGSESRRWARISLWSSRAMTHSRCP